MKRSYVLLLACAFVAISNAGTLTLSIGDPVGDNTGPIDLTGVVLTFDNSSGNFSYTVTADPANPFNGTFNLNINLFDPAADGFAGLVNPDFFTSDTVQNLASPTTSITITGNSAKLTFWNAGDLVSYDDTPFGNPVKSPCCITSFQSNVVAGGSVSDAFGSFSQGDFTALQAPEPGTASFLTLALCGFALLASKFRLRHP